jgi:hypothetical protein
MSEVYVQQGVPFFIKFYAVYRNNNTERVTRESYVQTDRASFNRPNEAFFCFVRGACTPYHGIPGPIAHASREFIASVTEVASVPCLTNSTRLCMRPHALTAEIAREFHTESG